ncbi:MAG: Sua5/YciO/YrdC/YwlC family protein [Planctomycetaceae bacterium]
MSQILNIRNSDDPRDIIHLAVQALADGEIVAFPSETSYLVAGYSLQESAAERLKSILESINPGENKSGSCFLALKSGAQLADYTGRLEGIGRKLSRRCWPGPVNLSFPLPDRAESSPTLLSVFFPCQGVA